MYGVLHVHVGVFGCTSVGVCVGICVWGFRCVGCRYVCVGVCYMCIHVYKITIWGGEGEGLQRGHHFDSKC